MEFEKPTNLAPPAHLSADAKKEWKRQAAQLERVGLLQEADMAILAAYCEAVGEFVQACRELKKGGHTFVTEKGYEGQSPWVAIKNHAADRIAKFGALFGLSPSARTRVKGMEKPAADAGKTGKARFFATGG